MSISRSNARKLPISAGNPSIMSIISVVIDYLWDREINNIPHLPSPNVAREIPREELDIDKGVTELAYDAENE